MAVEMAVALGRRGREATARPFALLAGDAVSVDANEIIGVDLAAPPGRDRRAGLRDEHRALGGQVMRCDVARRRLVIVTGEQEIDARLGNRLERRLGAPDDPAVGGEERRHQRVMRDEDAELLARELAEKGTDLVHLVVRDAAIAEGCRARRVDAENGDLGIGEERVMLRRDVMPKALERPEDAAQRVIERHVVITGATSRSRKLRAAANSWRRARCVRSPLTATRSGFCAARSASRASAIAGS